MSYRHSMSDPNSTHNAIEDDTRQRVPESPDGITCPRCQSSPIEVIDEEQSCIQCGWRYELSRERQAEKRNYIDLPYWGHRAQYRDAVLHIIVVRADTRSHPVKAYRCPSMVGDNRVCNEEMNPRTGGPTNHRALKCRLSHAILVNEEEGYWKFAER